MRTLRYDDARFIITQSEMEPAMSTVEQSSGLIPAILESAPLSGGVLAHITDGRGLDIFTDFGDQGCNYSQEKLP